jgi:hypothetical protein
MLKIKERYNLSTSQTISLLMIQTTSTMANQRVSRRFSRNEGCWIGCRKRMGVRHQWVTVQLAKCPKLHAGSKRRNECRLELGWRRQRKVIFITLLLTMIQAMLPAACTNALLSRLTLKPYAASYRCYSPFHQIWRDVSHDSRFDITCKK